jgi:hypothetical protein
MPAWLSRKIGRKGRDVGIVDAGLVEPRLFFRRQLARFFKVEAATLRNSSESWA